MPNAAGRLSPALFRRSLHAMHGRLLGPPAFFCCERADPPVLAERGEENAKRTRKDPRKIHEFFILVLGIHVAIPVGISYND